MKSKKRYGMLVDVDKCIGCHACEIACKMAKGTPLGHWRSWVKEIQKGSFPNVSWIYMPVFCNQCENPICVTVCPVKASIKREEDGIVVIDPHRCKGCRFCTFACPYGMRYLDPDLGIAQKCDFCLERLEVGLKPICVEVCPTGALIFGDLNDKNSEIYKRISTEKVFVLRPETGNEPHVYYTKMDVEVEELRGYREE